jgi:hypothetical protein
LQIWHGTLVYGTIYNPTLFFSAYGLVVFFVPKPSRDLQFYGTIMGYLFYLVNLITCIRNFVVSAYGIRHPTQKIVLKRDIIEKGCLE